MINPRDIQDWALNTTNQAAEAVKNATDHVGSQLSEAVRNTTDAVGHQLAGAKDALAERLPKPEEKPDEVGQAVLAYNLAYTEMSDAGMALHIVRHQTSDLIAHIENLINSVAASPKEFETAFEEIRRDRENFSAVLSSRFNQLEEAKKATMSAGAGAAAGMAIVNVAPTAAMWVATTFGTASTGAAISTLSGAAATNAALAWLGGGALAAGGGGMAAGSTLLALAGPIGWTAAGAIVLVSVTLFAAKDRRNQNEQREFLARVKDNTTAVQLDAARTRDLLARSRALKDQLADSYDSCLAYYQANFADLEPAQQLQLGALVNQTTACSQLLNHTIAQESDGD